MKQLELEQLIESARIERRSELVLYCSQSTILPASLSQLTDLTWLSITICGSIHLPTTIGSLVKLTYLEVKIDTSHSLPESFFSFSRDLNLTRKHRSIKLPESIGNLANLQHLLLIKSKLSSLSDSFGNLSSLEILNLQCNQLSSLPKSFGNLSHLIDLDLYENQLTCLPDKFGSLVSLEECCLGKNDLTTLPDSFGNLCNLINLDLSNNQLTSLPESFGSLSSLIKLNLRDNHLTHLPAGIGNLLNLTWLDLSNNYLTSLPQTISNLVDLQVLRLDLNPLTDLSMLQGLSQLKQVTFLNIDLPPRYWTKFSEWEPEWLLDEGNTEIRRILIEQVGYEKICEKLDSIELDTWREYTLLKIDGLQLTYDSWRSKPTGTEPMMFLKMTCPSTAHVHILRVPPDMANAEAAITWVNHGIHPDKFAIQT
jgi:leucine-rich repeat protein SHOC2